MNDCGTTPEEKTPRIRAPRKPHHSVENAAAARRVRRADLRAALYKALPLADHQARGAPVHRRAPADAAHHRGREPRHHLRPQRHHSRHVRLGGDDLPLSQGDRGKRAGSGPDRKRSCRDPGYGRRGHPQKDGKNELAVRRAQEKGGRRACRQGAGIHQRERPEGNFPAPDEQAQLSQGDARIAGHRLCQRQRRRDGP